MSNRATCPACGCEVVKWMPAQSSRDKIADALRRVWSMEGLTTAAGFALFFMLSRYVVVFVVFYGAGLVGYYFGIVHHVGDGEDGLPGPSDAVDDWAGTVALFLKGVLCACAGLLPLLGWLIATHDLPGTAGTIALVVAGQLYMPAAILAVTVSNRALAVAWPPAWIAIVARAPRAYLRFAGLWLASVAAFAVVYVATSTFVDGGLSLTSTTEAPLATWGLGALAGSFIWTLFAFAQASLVGLYIRENAAQFGWE